jgi:hypothetical protein
VSVQPANLDGLCMQLIDNTAYLKAATDAEPVTRSATDAVLGTYFCGDLSTFGTLNTSIIPITSFSQVGGFTIVANAVVVPAAGVYDVALTVSLKMSSTSNPQLCQLDLRMGGTAIDSAIASRLSGNSNDYVCVKCRRVVTITTPAAQAIDVFPNSGGGTYTPVAGGGTILIRRIS